MNEKTVTELLQDLIRIPSENNGVTGYENDVQQYFFSWLKNHDLDAKLTYIEDIPGFDEFPGRLLERNLRNRPIVTARLKGNRPGKTTLLLAHADKWGLAVMGCVMAGLKEEGCDFPGELVIASVPDEESGGGNGTVAVFASGITADEAVYLDGGSNQTIWRAGLGGGYCRVTGKDKEAIRRIMLEFKEKIKAKLDAHASFGPEFFPLIAKQFYLISQKGDALSVFLDVLPGESEAELKREFESLFPQDCSFRWMSRFLKAADIPEESPLVVNLKKAFAKVTGREASSIGGVQSDQGLVVTFGHTPCVLFGCGRRGLPGSSHLPNEVVEEARLFEMYHTFFEFVKGQE